MKTTSRPRERARLILWAQSPTGRPMARLYVGDFELGMIVRAGLERRGFVVHGDVEEKQEALAI
jgi:hypothetical protein